MSLAVDQQQQQLLPDLGVQPELQQPKANKKCAFAISQREKAADHHQALHQEYLSVEMSCKVLSTHHILVSQCICSYQNA